MISLEVHVRNDSVPRPVLLCLSGHSPPTCYGTELNDLVSELYFSVSLY